MYDRNVAITGSTIEKDNPVRPVQGRQYPYGTLSYYPCTL